MGLEEMLDEVVDLGLEAVEIGTGNYPGDRHCKPAELLGDDEVNHWFRDAFDRRGLVISALSCPPYPIHPNAERAAKDDAVFRDTVRVGRPACVDRRSAY